MERFIGCIPVFLFTTGVFFMIRLRFFYLVHPVRCLRLVQTETGKGGISPLRALSVALAGTLGVGNIVGVASALYAGGPGSLVWMLVSTFSAMVLKYVEIVLAMRHRRRDQDGRWIGGAPYYIRDGFADMGWPKTGVFLSVLFSVLCLVNAVTMGSILQINAVSGTMQESFSVPPPVTGITFAVLCAVLLKGGAKRIAAWTEKLVPLMTVCFLSGCLAVLISRRERIPEAISSVIRDAFHPEAAVSGIGGFLLSRGVRFGVMRGLISNEAGCGTAPMAHAVADTQRPAAQGVLGIVEVFVDTVLLCSITALTILVSDSGPYAFGNDAVRTAGAAFSSVLGSWAGGLFSLCILFFGGATVLCWTHYGATCARSLCRNPRLADGLFCAVFSASLIFGSLSAPEAVWNLADVAIACMTVLNIPVLLLRHREIEAETVCLTQSRDQRIYSGCPR